MAVQPSHTAGPPSHIQDPPVRAASTLAPFLTLNTPALEAVDFHSLVHLVQSLNCF